MKCHSLADNRDYSQLRREDEKPKATDEVVKHDFEDSLMAYFTPAFVHTSTGVMPAWLPTQAVFNDVREWDVSVAPHGTILQRPLIQSAILNNPARIRVSLYRMLLEAGMAFTRGVGQPPLSASTLAPLYRYIDLFIGTSPHLRMIAGIKNVDPRFKQLIAEELSLGITCYVLREHMDVIHISDFEPLLYPLHFPTIRKPTNFTKRRTSALYRRYLESPPFAEKTASSCQVL